MLALAFLAFSLSFFSFLRDSSVRTSNKTSSTDGRVSSSRRPRISIRFRRSSSAQPLSNCRITSLAMCCFRMPSRWVAFRASKWSFWRPEDEELQLSWQVLFTVTKNPGTTNIIPYKIQVYQWQYMYNNTFHNKNHLTSSSYCVQMPWHQLSQQLGRRHLLTNHHISFKFLYMTKHQGTGRLAWNRHFKANLPWEKLERNHKSITYNLSVKSLHCPKHWLVAGLATSHCLTQWMDTELTTLRIPNLPMQA